MDYRDFGSDTKMMRGNIGGNYPSPNQIKRPRMDDNYDDYSNRLSGPADYGSVGGGNVSGGGGSQSSRVLSVRNLGENVMEADIVEALAHFGAVSYVSLTGRGTALVEFEELQAAERVVNYNLSTDIMILNQSAIFSFSNLQIIPRQGVESDRPNHVLVMYVQNPKYPITTDVINAICKPVSRVVRIMIIREGGNIQCLVEFADVEAARSVKQRLNGCDIYSGCCTLKIEYCKLGRLHVTKNDQDTADYVTPPSALNVTTNFSAAAKDRPALLQEPPVFTGPVDTSRQSRNAPVFSNETYDDFGRAAYDGQRFANPPVDRYPTVGSMGGMGPGRGMGGGGGYEEEYDYGDRDSRFGSHPAVNSMAFVGHGGGGGNGGGMYGHGGGMDGGYGGDPRGGGGREPDGYGMGEDNAVLMIYGLNPDKVNCDKLFNLFCQYGNVYRIKFLKSKNDTVMVQMGDAVAAQRAMENLRQCTVFGGKMSVTVSRQARLNEVREPTELPDKTLSYKDYSSTRNNRFLSADIAAKNRINAPQKYLYFFNAPPHISEEDLLDVFKNNGAPKPVTVKIFAKKENYAKNSAGIFEFENEDEAVEAIMLCNHVSLDSEGGRNPFLMKMCFAGPPSSSVNTDGSGGGGGGGGRSGGYSSRSSVPNNYNGPAGFARGRDDDRGGDRRSSAPRGGGRGRGDRGGRGRGRGGGGGR